MVSNLLSSLLAADRIENQMTFLSIRFSKKEIHFGSPGGSIWPRPNGCCCFERQGQEEKEKTKRNWLDTSMMNGLQLRIGHDGRVPFSPFSFFFYSISLCPPITSKAFKQDLMAIRFIKQTYEVTSIGLSVIRWNVFTSNSAHSVPPPRS